MTHYTNVTQEKVVYQHIQDERPIKNLAAKYGVLYLHPQIPSLMRDCRKE